VPKKPQQLAKLSRPRLYDALPRERLFALLDEKCLHPAVWIAGPPGAGKTTLIGSYLERRTQHSIWYQLDSGDADLATFFYYLGEAAKPFTRKGQRTLPLLSAEYLQDLEGFSRRFFRELFSRLPVGATLVMDNYQEVGQEDIFHQIVSDAVNEVPEGLTLFVVSRSDPPSHYARAIANERVGFVDWDALKLGQDEAQAIGAGRVGAAQEDIARIHELSAGWVAGFTLLLEQLRQGRRPDATGQRDSLAAVFNYFAGQLFEHATPDIQRLLLRLSFLPHMSASVATELTGSEGVVTLLEDMHRRHLFTDRHHSGEAVYQFHALLQAFLQDRASRILALAEQNALTLEAARILDQRGQPEEALPLYLKAGDTGHTRTLILREASKLIGQGRWKLVVEWIAALPRELVLRDRRLMHWLGTATMSIDPRNARESLEKSFELAAQEADELCQLQAAAAIIETYMAEYTHFQPLDRWIAVLENKITALFLFVNAEIELRVQSALLIALAFRQPGSPRLAPCVERVFELLQSDVDINLRASAATYLLRYGATTGPLEVSRQALLELEPLLGHPEVTAYNAASAFAAASWFHCLCRSRSQCMGTSARAERIAKEHGLSSPAKIALINRMWLALFEFDTVESRSLLERVEQLVSHTHPFDVATLHGARAWIALGENRLEEALDYDLKAVAFFDKAGSTMHRINFRLGLITILVACRQFDSARSRIAQVREIAGESITFWQRNALCASEASIALEECNLELARERLRVALGFARECGDDFSFSNWSRPWMPRLCQEALKSGIEMAYVRELIQRYDFPAPSSDVEFWPWRIKVYVFGRFQVLVDERTLSFNHKTPRKPLALLKALIAFGGREVTQAKLIDALWSEEDGDAAQQSLTTALHRLRKLLGSHDLIIQRDGKLSIDPDRVWVDAFAFEELCNRAGEGRKVEQAPDYPALASKAITLYRGGFLGGDADPAWALTTRERLRQRFIELIAGLGEHFEHRQQYEDASALYRSGIEIDSLAEIFYLGIMRCQHETGRTSDALSTYQRMQRELATSPGVRPSAITESFYRSLRSG
jgi:DNA-binding SARP family transcriptional activator